MTYLGPDKRQYVAVAAGVGGAAMVQQDRPGFLPRGNTVYVFSIDGESIQDSKQPATVTSPQ
jgi:alcohol dehydrogenase (cytochrome c)